MTRIFILFLLKLNILLILLRITNRSRCIFFWVKTSVIPTGISLAIPENFEIQIRPRSGLAAKNQISVLNTPGTIDADYRGEIKVILINLGKKTFLIEKGARIAQMVLCPIEKAKIREVENLEKTKRGSGGFGSTGTK